MTRPPREARAGPALAVSVVVPVRDEAEAVSGLLDSLRAQSRAPSEIVVVDGGSRDRTLEIVARSAREDARIRLVRAQDAFPGVGRNLGVETAVHDVIAFSDAGIRLEPGWLEALCAPMEADPTVDVVYGHLDPVTDTFFRECAALAYVPAPAVRDGIRIRAPFLPSSLMRRAVWARVGGFPPFRAAEDLIFMEAVARGGFRIAYAPAAVAHWQIAPTWAATFHRFATYSRENLRAGRARYWHYGVARLYGIGLGCLVLAALQHPFWALGAPAGLVARTTRMAHRKRAAFAFHDVFRPKRLFCLAALLVLLDAATAWGAWLWLWRDRLRPAALRAPGG